MAKYCWTLIDLCQFLTPAPRLGEGAAAKISTSVTRGIFMEDKYDSALLEQPLESFYVRLQILSRNLFTLEF